MNPIKNVAYVLVITVLLVGCNDFGNLNVDSNNPSEVRTDLLMAGAQTGVSDVVGAATPVIWTQYITETQYDDVPRYNPTEANFNSWYYDELQDLQTIIDLNTDEETKDDVLSGGSNANQIAVARIMKVYFFQMITDRWGNVPYSEALQGSDNLSPAYDSQEDIYADLVVELQEAVEQMDSGAGVKGDILFEGDMEQWALFANSLRARVALRMADAAPSLAETHFTDAVNDGLITEDVMYPFLADAENENPWYTRFRTRTDYAISDVIGDYMLDLDDNRILVYANPAPDEDNNDGVVEFSEIVPMDYDAPAPGDITNSSISFPGDAIGAGGEGIQDAPLPIITTAELEFAQAEAVERGWITGVAADHYNSGIEASWNQWGVFDTADFAAYIATPEVAYSSAEWDEKIGVQKWIALYPNGYEAYAEWRRLDYPALEPHDRALTQSEEIPVRFTYPSTEAEINAASYEAAVSAQGPDTPDTKVWWDVD
ncbi:MAG: SusD/RagB family nutrient-binding outer membrane lipoprotein [Balneolaceae bacterium]